MTDSHRFVEAAQPSRYLDLSVVLVRCPRCEGRAVARRGDVRCGGCGFARRVAAEDVAGVRVNVVARCADCGRRLRRALVRSGATRGVSMRCDCGWSDRVTAGISPVDPLAQGRDPGTGLPLWLCVPFRGRLLWAVDADHLTFLENYVGARLRESGPGNSTLASRLPAWIKSAANRDDVLRLLRRLRRSLED